ncbi:MAG: hypothetical protein BWY57_02651 [Betaproteobacteria bacterium ADurb.Bin341]|nr:MAG: hypothetical protein BWY57_02651 [Betaproteobacteria bacterium ADurb.Bin341]
MHADIAGQIFQLFRQGKKLADGLAVLFVRHQGLERRFLGQRLGERQWLVLHDRNELGNVIAQGIGQVKDTADIAHHRLRRHGAEGGDLAHRFSTVTLADIFDDTPTVVLTEIDVKVGHRHPLRVQKTLKQQGIGEWIKVGNAEAVGDQRTGAGTAPRPDRNAVVLGPVDEIGDDQEIPWKAHLDDGLALEIEPRFIFGALFLAQRRIGIQLGQPFFQTFFRQIDKILVKAHAVRCREIRQEILAQRQLDIAALGDFQSVFQRLRQIGKERGHFGLTLEILLFGKRPRPARITQHITLGDTDAGLMRLKILTRHELDGMRRHQRQVQFTGQTGYRLHLSLLLRLTVALHFQIIGAWKEFGPGFGAFLRQFPVAGRQRFADIALPCAGKCNQAVTADIAEPFAAEFRLVAPIRHQISQRQQFA